MLPQQRSNQSKTALIWVLTAYNSNTPGETHLWYPWKQFLAKFRSQSRWFRVISNFEKLRWLWIQHDTINSLTILLMYKPTGWSEAILVTMVNLFSNVTATTTISGPATTIFSAATTAWRPKMIVVPAARAWELLTTAFHAKHTTVVAAQSNPDIALYSMAAKEHVMLRIITSPGILVR